MNAAQIGARLKRLVGKYVPGTFSFSLHWCVELRTIPGPESGP
jgi:hypothetical protein